MSKSSIEPTVQTPGSLSSKVAATAHSERVSALAIQMAQQWQQGDRPTVEGLLALEPDLLSTPEVVLELLYDEMALRKQHEGRVDLPSIVQRFPQWQQQIEVLGKVHSLLEPLTLERSALPVVGETLGDLCLIAELGRGAEGCVFLARQTSLADRLLVLKLTPCRGEEHLSLARLQHTHIVPLSTVVYDEARQLRILCMPYFGGATLSDALEALQAMPFSQRSGKDLADVLDRVELQSGDDLSRSTARQFLNRATWPQAVCWLGACLADALQYAHEHDLVHLDVKPSNVLLTGEGHPMLLDFHLARRPLATGTEQPGIVGGTVAYMSPEQHAIMGAIREKKPCPSSLDGRSDIYSLGAVLYLALGGTVPYLPGSSPALTTINPEVSPGLSDIIARCLATEAADRYSSAGAMAQDLRLHLADQPLREAPNRSLRERWQKWRRRRPYFFALVMMMVAVLGAASSVGISAWMHFSRQHQQAKRALQEAREQLRRGDPDSAIRTLTHGIALAEEIPFQGDLVADLQGQLGRARRMEQQSEWQELLDQLHQLTQQMQFLYGNKASPTELQRLSAHCGELWKHREHLLSRAETLEVVKQDLLDLAILWIDVERQLGPPRNQWHQKALDILAQAEKVSGPAHILHRQKAYHARCLGLSSQARDAASKAQATSPRTAWDHYVLGRSILYHQREMATIPAWSHSQQTAAMLLSIGLRLAAASHFEEAVTRDPSSLWPSYYRGRCAYYLGRHRVAIESFSVCIGADPTLPWLFYNRAMARAALGQSRPALADYHHAQQRSQRQELSSAPVYFNLALATLAQGKREDARDHLWAILKNHPGHPEAIELLKQIDPARAIFP